MGDNFLLPSRGNHQPNVRALFENKRAMANRYNNTHFAKKKKKRKVSTKRKRGERIQVRPPTRSVAEGEQLSFIDSKTLEKTFDPHLDNDAKLWFDQHVLNLYKSRPTKYHTRKAPTPQPPSRSSQRRFPSRQNAEKRDSKSGQKTSNFGRTLTDPSVVLGTEKIKKKAAPAPNRPATSPVVRKKRSSSVTSNSSTVPKEDPLLTIKITNIGKMNVKVVDDIKLKIREKCIPAIQSQVTKLSKKYRELHSKRMFLEEQVQVAINQVRANKLPDKWKSEFWDDMTGTKLTMGALEEQQKRGESQIEEMKAGKLEAEKQYAIYQNILDRTKREYKVLRASVADIKVETKNVERRMYHQEVKKRQAFETNARIQERIKEDTDKLKLQAVEHKGEIMALETEFQEKKEVIKDAIETDKRRIQVSSKAREAAKGILTTKINIEKIESMKSKSVRGWLTAVKNESRPILEAVKTLQKKAGVSDPDEFVKQYLNGEERQRILAERIQELEQSIEEKKHSLTNWKGALTKMVDSGISTSLKTKDTEIWDLQEHVEHRKSTCMSFEERCKGIEYLVEELDYGINGMMTRLGLRKKKKERSDSTLYFNVASDEKLLKDRDEENLNKVLKSIDEAGAAKAAIAEARAAREKKHEDMLAMVKEWFDLVTERKSMLSYFVHTKNTRMLEKYSRLIKRLSYTPKGRTTLKFRESLITSIKRCGQPVAASSNSAISMLHRVLGRQKPSTKKISLKGLMGTRRRLSNAFKPKSKGVQAPAKTAKSENEVLYEDFAEKMQRDGWCASPENRRVSPVKHREMLQDEVGNELAIIYSDEQKTILKTSTKLLLHRKLWEAEALKDQSGIRQAEAALDSHGFKRLKKPKAKKARANSNLHKPKRLTTIQF